jgi:hypothetical protein
MIVRTKETINHLGTKGTEKLVQSIFDGLSLNGPVQITELRLVDVSDYGSNAHSVLIAKGMNGRKN